MPRIKRKYKRGMRGAIKRTNRRPARHYRATPFYARSNQLAGFGLPDKVIAKHRYVEEFQLDPSSVSPVAYYVFSANGMYDPNITSTGHQPYAFDQLGGIYNTYKVLSSTIKVTPVNIASANLVSGYLGVLLTPDTTTGASLSGGLQMIESNIRGKRIIIGGNFQDSHINNGYTVKHRFNQKEYFGVLDEDQNGSTSANPAEQAYYTVCYTNMYGNDPGNTTFLATIEYTAEWSEPKLLAMS